MAEIELTDCCKVTCMAEEPNRWEWTVFVPSRLLWSPEGMAELFRICRSQLADPARWPDDPAVERSFDSFHVVAIEEVDGTVIDLEWEPHEVQP